MLDSSETVPQGDAHVAVDPAQLYGSWYYHSYAMPYEQENWGALMAHIAHGVVTSLGPTTALDAGCAKGFLVAALRDRGVQAWGVDVSEVAIKSAPESVRPYVRVGSLTEPIRGHYDLVTCIEVIEHLDPADTHEAVANICACTDAVLLSTTPGDQDEPTHVNVQPSERWAQLFAAYGFFRDFTHDATFISPWAVLYRRRSKTLDDVVVDYERDLGRLRSLALEHRSGIDALRGQIAELPEAELPNLDDLRGEVDRLRRSGRAVDEKLGAVKGMMAEVSVAIAGLEPSRARLEQIYGSKSWRVGQMLGLPLRALRRRPSR